MQRSPFLAAVTVLMGVFLAFGPAATAEPPEKRLRVYHIGNSLTRNVPLERLAELFKSIGVTYDYGIQLGGGHQLDQHLSMRNHGNKPGQGKYNTKAPYGTYDKALREFTFNALVLQPYGSALDKPEKITSRWPYYEAGALQAASAFIDYARGNTRPGEDRWDRQHPNTDHVATDRFYIYATWPGAAQVLEAGGYAEFWGKKYLGGDREHCADYFEQLVRKLNETHPDLSQPVRLIPAGHVLAELDRRIRVGELPGIADFYERNQAYFIKSRRNNKGKSPFDPEQFQPSAGVLNFYADGVHMNDQPHNGRDSGTIGSYTAALTIYAVLTGQSPVGLTAEPYEQFDPAKDAALIRAIQETVWDVVTGNPQTGVKPAGGEPNTQPRS